MNRNETPVAFFASVLIHLMVLFAAARWLGRPRPVPPFEPEAPPEPIARVVFPPPQAWMPPAPPSQTRPAAPPSRPDRPKKPEPTPEPAREARDRVSIGGPAPERQKTPLELRRDEDLSRRVAKGRPDAPGTAASPTPGAPPAAPPEEPAVPEEVAAVEAPAADVDTLSAAPIDDAAAPPARRGAPVGPPAPADTASIAGSLRRLEDRLAGGPVGVESGAGQQMGDLFFDPQGADFTAWANSFRIEVYRNWIVPQSVRFGARGHVQIEFRIERDGRISALRIVRESGTPALDRAAANALLGGRFPPLPSDYRPAQLAIQVSFFYNERAGS